MSTHDVVESFRQQALEEGVQKGLAQGLERGLAQGLVAAYEARFGEMPSELRKTVEGAHDEATLRGWFKLFSTCSADEIAAALRRRRSS